MVDGSTESKFIHFSSLVSMGLTQGLLKALNTGTVILTKSHGLRASNCSCHMHHR